MRGGILAAEKYRPTAAEIEGQQTRKSLDDRLKEIEAIYPIPNLDPIKLCYAVTAGDKIEGLRQWASGRCLSADRAGVYSRAEQAGGCARRIVREPGVN